MKASQMYQLSLQECADTIRTIGNKRTILMRGHMGIGKSSTLNMLAQAMPKHLPCYFDCTTKDLGDITIPNVSKLNDGSGFVQYLTNEELGCHLDKPILLMIDEYGKGNRSLQNSMLRLNAGLQTHRGADVGEIYTRYLGGCVRPHMTATHGGCPLPTP